MFRGGHPFNPRADRFADIGDEREWIVIGFGIGKRRDPPGLNDRLVIGRIGVLEPGGVETARRLEHADDAGNAPCDRVERAAREQGIGDGDIECASLVAQAKHGRVVDQPDIVVLAEKGAPLFRDRDTGSPR